MVLPLAAAAEVSFQLPMDASSSFKGLFEQLDDQLEQLHVETYGMSVTTLEEVFVKIVRGGRCVAPSRLLW